MLARDASTFADVYREKYKGLAQTILVLANALSGSFANLGAFQAYEDTALPETIRLGIQMCLAIPEDGENLKTTPATSHMSTQWTTHRRLQPTHTKIVSIELGYIPHPETMPIFRSKAVHPEIHAGYLCT